MRNDPERNIEDVVVMMKLLTKIFPSIWGGDVIIAVKTDLLKVI